MNHETNVKRISVSVLGFNAVVKSILDEYSVSTSGDYAGEVNDTVSRVVQALLGKESYDAEFKKLTNYLYNTLASLDYKQAVDLATQLITELSNTIGYTTDAVDKNIIMDIRCGKLHGHLLVLECDGNTQTNR